MLFDRKPGRLGGSLGGMLGGLLGGLLMSSLDRRSEATELRLTRAQIDEAMERCQLHRNDEGRMCGPDGLPPTAEQSVELVHMLKTVELEGEQRALQATRRLTEARAQEAAEFEARKKAAYDAAAAPFKEARRLKKLQSFNQRNHQEEKTQS